MNIKLIIAATACLIFSFQAQAAENIKRFEVNGVAIGDELEYADEITLGRSILDRTPFENTFSGRKQDLS